MEAVVVIVFGLAGEGDVFGGVDVSGGRSGSSRSGYHTVGEIVWNLGRALVIVVVVTLRLLAGRFFFDVVEDDGDESADSGGGRASAGRHYGGLEEVGLNSGDHGRRENLWHLGVGSSGGALGN